MKRCLLFLFLHVLADRSKEHDVSKVDIIVQKSQSQSQYLPPPDNMEPPQSTWSDWSWEELASNETEYENA